MKAAYSIGIITLFERGAKHQKLLHKWELTMGAAEERCCQWATIMLCIPRKVLVEYCKNKRAEEKVSVCGKDKSKIGSQLVSSATGYREINSGVSLGIQNESIVSFIV